MGHTSREIWKERIARWRESGLTARRFAEDNKVNVGTLTSWKYKLAAESQRVGRTASAPRVEFVEVTGLPSARASRPAGPSFEVMCIGGRSVRVPDDFDAEALWRLVGVLERR